ncbi:MAG: hypothetical protein LKM41_11855 [Lachnospiraceae bacterium]|nr:hypothetical protein [Lachnospiraceae bacterium]
MMKTGTEAWLWRNGIFPVRRQCTTNVCVHWDSTNHPALEQGGKGQFSSGIQGAVRPEDFRTDGKKHHKIRQDVKG